MLLLLKKLPATVYNKLTLIFRGLEIVQTVKIPPDNLMVVDTSAVSNDIVCAFEESGESCEAVGSVSQAFVGVAAVTESSEKISATGSETFAGTSTVTESGEGISAVGSQVFASTATVAESGEAVAGVASEVFAGVASFTESGEAMFASGEELFTAIAALIESGESFEAKASSGVTITGTASFTESGESLDATGVVKAKEPTFMWTAGGWGKLGTNGIATIRESTESFSARGTVIIPETKGQTGIEEILEEEMILFSMIEGD